MVRTASKPPHGVELRDGLGAGRSGCDHGWHRDRLDERGLDTGFDCRRAEIEGLERRRERQHDQRDHPDGDQPVDDRDEIGRCAHGGG
jgi:hypothetical protein